MRGARNNHLKNLDCGTKNVLEQAVTTVG